VPTIEFFEESARLGQRQGSDLTPKPTQLLLQVFQFCRFLGGDLASDFLVDEETTAGVLGICPRLGVAGGRRRRDQARDGAAVEFEDRAVAAERQDHLADFLGSGV
jgi:hypothetical protein